MEINPFHNGHLYFLKEAKKIVKDNLLVCIISTNIVQRGEVSVLNKKVKTDLLLKNGVDIVCELPAVLANQGGEYFAFNALNILKEFNIDSLIFGSENPDINTLVNHANIIQSDTFENGLHSKLNTLKSNEILAISYIKAAKCLNLDLDFYPIQRIDNNYNDTKITSNIASATSIRRNIKDKDLISKSMPLESLDNTLMVNEQILFDIFKINIVNCLDNNIHIFLSEENQLLKRMNSILTLHNPNSISELLNLCKDKNNSKYKYSRILINTVLLIVEDKYNTEPYVRILGFNKLAAKHIPENSFTSLANKNDKISLIEKRVSRLFSLVTNNFDYNEYDKKPIIYKG